MDISKASLKYLKNGDYRLVIEFEASPNMKEEVTEGLTKVVVNLTDSMFSGDGDE